MAQIHEAICAAMSRTGAITKDKKNAQQGFKYRGVDDVMNALQPIFSEFLIFCTPKVLDRKTEERVTKNGSAMTHTILTVEYIFHSGVDESSVSCIVCGEAMDSADKSTSKAMSIAFKYACFQLLCIPTEETAPDPDAEYHVKAPKSQDPAKKSQEPAIVCTKCGAEIKPKKAKDGRVLTAKEVAESLGGLCPECWKNKKAGE